MAQYIDKDALVAEIERRINGINLDTIEDWRYRLQWEHDIEVMKNILSLIDTLEVKEVDLEKVIEEYFKGWTDDYDNGGAACHYQYVQVNDCKAIAKHFFELGLKTQKE